MAEIIFGHDRLDVYRLAVDYTADSYRVANGLSGLRRHARDQWLRAAQPIPLASQFGGGAEETGTGRGPEKLRRDALQFPGQSPARIGRDRRNTGKRERRRERLTRPDGAS